MRQGSFPFEPRENIHGLSFLSWEEIFMSLVLLKNLRSKSENETRQRSVSFVTHDLTTQRRSLFKRPVHRYLLKSNYTPGLILFTP